MKRVDKKGLSPVVASVLLVALVLVLASIIFLWARGFIGEQIEKGDAPIEDSCDLANFNFVITHLVGNNYDVEILNNGNIAIYSFIIVKTLGGSQERSEFEFTALAQEGIQRELDLGIDGKNPEKITIYPTILGTEAGTSTNRPYTCTEHGKTEVL